MGQFLHGSAKTTHAIRAELQRSKASAAEFARRYGINEKTVLKWRKRQSVEDMPMGPKMHKSTVLSAVEEAAIVSLRVQARLPLGKCLHRFEGRAPASVVLEPTSLLAAAWHLSSAQDRSGEAEAVQGIRDRLLSHRHCRTTIRRWQGFSLCRG